MIIDILKKYSVLTDALGYESVIIPSKNFEAIAKEIESLQDLTLVSRCDHGYKLEDGKELFCCFKKKTGYEGLDKPISELVRPPIQWDKTDEI